MRSKRWQGGESGRGGARGAQVIKHFEAVTVFVTLHVTKLIVAPSLVVIIFGESSVMYCCGINIFIDGEFSILK